MQHATICIPIRENKILLGMKKRGFGKGKYNGFGGKVAQGENILEAAARELYEEAGIKAGHTNLNKYAELEFVFPHAPETKPGETEWNQIVHVFLLNDWEGSPMHSEEMDFEWFEISNLPLGLMWDDDKYWLPLILKGRRIKAKFVFDKDNATVKEKIIQEKEQF